MRTLRAHLASESGQGMSEYIITVALIGIAAIGAVGLFGDNIRAIFGASADALAGAENRESNASEAGAGFEGHKNLKKFATGNSVSGGGVGPNFAQN